MNNTDQEYNRLLNLVLEKGRVKTNRTGIDTIGTFGTQARFNLQEGFPLLTTKKVFFKGIAHELLWFLKGDTNIKYLVDNNVHIWDEWAYAKYKKTSVVDIGFNGLASAAATGWEQDVRHYTQPEFIEKIKTNENFATRWGQLGEGTYGGMWRKFPHYDHIEQGHGTMQRWNPVDQIQKLIDKLKSNPDDRRLIVSAWHPYWVDHCALPPCHVLFQFHTEELTWKERWLLIPQYNWSQEGNCHKDLFIQGSIGLDKQMDAIGVPRRRLNCQLYQRSCDLFLGVPFNIASYALLTHLIAHVTGMAAGEFVHTYGDLHIYNNHLEQVKEQLSRKPFDKLPTLTLNPAVNNLFDFKFEDITLNGYESHPAIKASVAV